MTNQAISVLLGHLSDVARNSIQAKLEGSQPWPGPAEAHSVPTNGIENMMRVIDDLRELVAEVPTEPLGQDRFDAARMIADLTELLNLVGAGPARRYPMYGPKAPCWVVQNRFGLDYAVTRLLDAALALAGTGELPVVVEAIPEGGGVRIALCFPDAPHATLIRRWLDQDLLHQAAFENADEFPAAVALMVAGRRFRQLQCLFLAGPDSGGSRLTVEVPSLPDGESADNLTQCEGSSGLKVLVAEDFDESFRLTYLALEEERVWRARNGWEALGLVRQQRFDLVLMDIHMPGLDGYSVIRAIREWETEAGLKRTPVIILSSDEIETQKRAAAQAGCTGFLHKPLCREELRGMIDKLRVPSTPTGLGPLAGGGRIH